MKIPLILYIISVFQVDYDTAYTMPTVDVTEHRQGISLEKTASPSITINEYQLNSHGITNQKSLSGIVPGLHIPDYGASLTSTIYLRGFGSRMENPALGMYIDDFPVADKNMYDFDWDGIRSVTLLRGPQAMLYGRNAMAGALSIQTLSSADLDGIRVSAEYGTANSIRTGITIPAGNHLINATFRHTDGYFMNECRKSLCDPYTGGGLNWKWEDCTTGRYLANIVRASFSNEGGFAYGSYRNDSILPVNYNDKSSYRRFSLLEGFKVRKNHNRITTQTSASLQLLADRMRMDQDYTPQSVFTLEQKQRMVTSTFEFSFRPVREYDHWKPKTGAFCYFKANDMSAPVEFRQDGINRLILNNANSNIPDGMGYLEFEETEFPVTSDFEILSWNTALYHESIFSLGRWLLTAGLRFDYEGAWMRYDSHALIHYRFVPNMSSFKPFSESYEGSTDRCNIGIFPKISAMYSVPTGNDDNMLAVYLTISEGFRAGGFNTQIFSDIIQGRMMNGLMADLGVYLDNPMPSVGAEHTVYDPEEAWNYELGIRFINRQHIQAQVNAYYMDGYNQQLTVFPPGKSTGRMMTNAGRSRSIGTEAQLSIYGEHFCTQFSYSLCDARFVRYFDGNNDYSGNSVPFIPKNTFYAGADWRIPVSANSVVLHADMRGCGPISWNESSTLREPAHLTIGGGISWTTDRIQLGFRGDNLTGNQHPVFYFKSVGNEFFALSKPRSIKLSVTINL